MSKCEQNRPGGSRQCESLCGKNLLTNCLTVFDHFVGLALKGLMKVTSSYLSINQPLFWAILHPTKMCSAKFSHC